MSAFTLQFDGIAKEFEDFGEVVRFVESERGNWQWLKDASAEVQNRGGSRRDSHSVRNDIINATTQFFGELRGLAERFRDNRDAPSQDNIERMQSSISREESTFGARPFVSASPKGNFVAELKAVNPVLAMYAAGFLMGLGIDPSSSESVEASARCMAFAGTLNAPPSVQAFTATFDMQSKRFEQQRNAEKIAFDGLHSEIAKNAGDQKTALAASKAEHADQIKEHDRVFREAQENARIALGQLEAIYDQKMALERPVQYWMARQKEHAKRANRSAVGVIAALILGPFMIYAVAYKLDVLGSKAADLPVVAVAVVAGVALCAIWVIRILVRVLLSELHLATDSGERAIMTRTYLALRRRESVQKTEDLNMILQALFRPAATGLVTDDGMPASWLEWVTKDRKP